jgi:hypothetical protein
MNIYLFHYIYSLVSGHKQEWYAPLHTFCEEVVVVPKVKGERCICIYICLDMCISLIHLDERYLNIDGIYILTYTYV